MKYTIITRDTADDLEEAVSAAIKEGWMPLGGVSVAAIETKGVYDNTVYVEWWAQAMTRNND